MSLPYAPIGPVALVAAVRFIMAFALGHRSRSVRAHPSALGKQILEHVAFSNQANACRPLTRPDNCRPAGDDDPKPASNGDIDAQNTQQTLEMVDDQPLPCPRPSPDRDHEGGFASALMLKDLKLAMEAADGVDASVPTGVAHESLYQAFPDLSSGGKVFRASAARWELNDVRYGPLPGHTTEIGAKLSSNCSNIGG